MRISLSYRDKDVCLVFPNGQEITIQYRPSNADGEDYLGSLDIILPNPQPVIVVDDQLQPTDNPSKQIILEIPKAGVKG
jgi:hypothetical protein